MCSSSRGQQFDSLHRVRHDVILQFARRRWHIFLDLRMPVNWFHCLEKEASDEISFVLFGLLAGNLLKMKLK